MRHLFDLSPNRSENQAKPATEVFDRVAHRVDPFLHPVDSGLRLIVRQIGEGLSPFDRGLVHGLQDRGRLSCDFGDLCDCFDSRVV